MLIMLTCFLYLSQMPGSFNVFSPGKDTIDLRPTQQLFKRQDGCPNDAMPQRRNDALMPQYLQPRYPRAPSPEPPPRCPLGPLVISLKLVLHSSNWLR